MLFSKQNIRAHVFGSRMREKEKLESSLLLTFFLNLLIFIIISFFHF